jgi:hypothetical protein
LPPVSAARRQAADVLKKIQEDAETLKKYSPDLAAKLSALAQNVYDHNWNGPQGNYESTRLVSNLIPVQKCLQSLLRRVQQGDTGSNLTPDVIRTLLDPLRNVEQSLQTFNGLQNKVFLDLDSRKTLATGTSRDLQAVTAQMLAQRETQRKTNDERELTTLRTSLQENLLKSFGVFHEKAANGDPAGYYSVARGGNQILFRKKTDGGYEWATVPEPGKPISFQNATLPFADPKDEGQLRINWIAQSLNAVPTADLSALREVERQRLQLSRYSTAVGSRNLGAETLTTLLDAKTFRVPGATVGPEGALQITSPHREYVLRFWQDPQAGGAWRYQMEGRNPNPTAQWLPVPQTLFSPSDFTAPDVEEAKRKGVENPFRQQMNILFPLLAAESRGESFAKPIEEAVKAGKIKEPIDMSREQGRRLLVGLLGAQEFTDNGRTAYRVDIRWPSPDPANPQGVSKPVVFSMDDNGKWQWRQDQPGQPYADVRPTFWFHDRKLPAGVNTEPYRRMNNIARLLYILNEASHRPPGP